MKVVTNKKDSFNTVVSFFRSIRLQRVSRFLTVFALAMTMVFHVRCTSEDAGYDHLKNDPFNPPSETISEDFTMKISDVNGSTDFIFETLATVDLYTIVLDANSPATGSLVQIREMSGDKTGRVVFRAVADEAGAIKGSFTIEASSPIVWLDLSYNGKDYTFQVDITKVQQINRTFYLNSLATQAEKIKDADSDGIADDKDHFPNDPSRATLVRYPAEGSYTIAFEDLYPSKGDADFNDYVFSLSHEEELNAQGQIVTLRGNYTHIAKGAGYNHTLNIRLPNTAGASLSLLQKSSAGVEKLNTTRVLSANEDIQLLGNSKNTISQSNTSAKQTFKAGDNLEFSVNFAAAVNRTELGAAPYDIYLYVQNTKHEIHFAGKYTKADGSDLFLDSDGFPWAILLPSDWRWMLETKNIHNAYPDFKDWYSSKGTSSLTWYNNYIAELVMLR